MSSMWAYRNEQTGEIMYVAKTRAEVNRWRLKEYVVDSSPKKNSQYVQDYIGAFVKIEGKRKD